MWANFFVSIVRMLLKSYWEAFGEALSLTEMQAGLPHVEPKGLN